MEKRYSDFLDNALDQLAYSPLIKLSKRQLKHFYGAERLNKNSWRDLLNRAPPFEQITENLAIVEDGDDIYLIKKDALAPTSKFI